MFASEVAVRFVGLDARRVRLLEPLVYRHRDGKETVVPAGEVSDGASVPRLLWWLVPGFTGRLMRAAILHDHWMRLIREGRPHPCAPDWAAANREFARAMRDADTDWVRWRIVLAAVEAVRLLGLRRIGGAAQAEKDPAP